MKKSTIIYSLIMLGAMFVFQSFILSTPKVTPKDEVVIPENVKVILDNKCFGCHNVDAKSDKAKNKLLLDKLSDLSKLKLVTAYTEINEVIVEGSMPPEKFLENKPEAKLTDEEAKILNEWSDKAANDLLK